MLEEFGIGSPLNPLTSQSANHKAALAKEAEERRRSEIARMWMNSQVAPHDPLDSLEKYLDLMADPKAFAKKVAEVKTLKADAAKAQKDLERAQHDEANVRQRTAAAQRASDEKITREKESHLDWMTAERREIEAERRELAKARAAADSDAAKAKELRAIAERKQRAYESA